jgi:hypothetical protein
MLRHPLTATRKQSRRLWQSLEQYTAVGGESSGVDKRVHTRWHANLKYLTYKLEAKLGTNNSFALRSECLSRWSAVVRGAVETGCRRNHNRSEVASRGCRFSIR